MSRDAIKIEGVVREVLPNQTMWVVLANGHRVLGFLSARMRAGAMPPHAGDRVVLEMSPFDMSRGRIVEQTT